MSQTNEVQEVWWKDPEYWDELVLAWYHIEEGGAIDYPIVSDIVAEAERRGERKAWEEAKGMIEAEKARIDSFTRSGFVFDVSIQIIDAKLNALK